MLLKRFYHEGLAQASYMIGCQKTGEALLVDANRDLRAYIDAAAENGVHITHVTETHIHADYLSGSRELAQATGAQLLLSGEGGPDWQYQYAAHSDAKLLRDSDSFMVGRIRIDVVHTPGHTPEHLTFVVTDTPNSSRPVGACTGDFIFVGDVGRPDLLERAANVEGAMRTGAAQLFASLQRFVAHYPDYLQLWPGHGSGSACGKALGAVPQTTLGYERVANWAMQIHNENDFIESVLDGQPDPPRYFAEMKRRNREGPAPIGEQLLPPRLTVESLELAMRVGVVVDVRRADEVKEGGIIGAINIPLKKSFVGWAGWLLPYDRPLYLVTPGEDEDSLGAAVKELQMIGLDRVEGWFSANVVSEWKKGGHVISTIPQTEPDELASLMTTGDGVTLIDVRAASEWDAGHIAGAQHIPLGRLEEHLAALDKSRPVVLQCQGGGRSSIAASILRAHGFGDVRNAAGGIERWTSSGRPVEREEVSTTV